MSLHRAESNWKGKLKDGIGRIDMPGCSATTKYSFPSRFGDGKGCSPEELIAGAHSACYSMALSHAVSQAGYEPEQVHTIATVTIEKIGEGFEITKINLTTQATIKKIEFSEFMKIAEKVQKDCPVSKALASVEIQLDAELFND